MAAREFVQKFYDWYAPALVAYSDARYARRPAGRNPQSEIMQAGRHLLSVDLIKALREDSTANSAGHREVFDADAVLSSQDPCAPYRVTRADVVGDIVRVAVKEVCNPIDPPWTRKLVVELTAVGTSFEISDFYYDHASLKSILCKFAMGDDRAEKRPATCPGVFAGSASELTSHVAIISAAVDSVKKTVPAGRFLIDPFAMPNANIHPEALIELLEKAGHPVATAYHSVQCHPSRAAECLDTTGANQYVRVGTPRVTGDSAEVALMFTRSGTAITGTRSSRTRPDGSTVGASYRATLRYIDGRWVMRALRVIGQS